MRPGALQEEFERRKKQLKQEGVFDRKLPLPLFPRHIVIISSPTGAAIQDHFKYFKKTLSGSTNHLSACSRPRRTSGKQFIASFVSSKTNNKYGYTNYYSGWRQFRRFMGV